MEERYGKNAAEVALDLVRTLRAELSERFGKREGRELGQQSIERLAVATMRGVGAQLAAIAAGRCGEDIPSNQVRTPGLSDESEGSEFRRWRRWAALHGFEPAPPANVPGSLGIRVLASAPAQSAEPERRLFWEDPTIGARVWTRD